ncbi:MAG TPA: MFS transporter [Solirubrobacteraceae bacterium]
MIVTAFFALDGFVFANWVVCVPQVKQTVGASSGGLGLALLAISAGAVATMVITGRLCAHFGSGRVCVAAATLLSVSIAVPGQTDRVWELAISLLVFGVGFGGLDVAMNSMAVELIARLRAPIMPGFHAAYSLGGLLGALAGGALAGVLSAGTHLLLIAAASLLVTAVLAVSLRSVGAPPPSAAAAGPRAAADPGVSNTRRLVALFGLIALCSAYGEGAMADWGSVHLHLDLHTSVSLAASGFASFSAAMVAGRLGGSWMLARAGRTLVLAGGALMAAAGVLLAALVPSLVVAIVGFTLVGFGFANLFPAALGEAGALAGPRGVAAASTIGYTGFLAGPPVIGFLAERVGLPAALTTISLLAAIAAVVAVAARRAEPALLVV